MKIGGHGRIERRSKDVFVGVDEDSGELIYIKVFETPIGLVQELMNELPVDPAPRSGEPLMDERGNIKKNASGAPLLEKNFNDTKWVTHIKFIEHLREVAMLYRCIAQGDGLTEVRWSTSRSDHLSNRNFYKAIADEMSAAGLNDPAFEALKEAANQLGTISEDAFKKARAELAQVDEQGNSSGSPPTGNSESKGISESLMTAGGA